DADVDVAGEPGDERGDEGAVPGDGVEPAVAVLVVAVAVRGRVPGLRRTPGLGVPGRHAGRPAGRRGQAGDERSTLDVGREPGVEHADPDGPPALLALAVGTQQLGLVGCGPDAAAVRLAPLLDHAHAVAAAPRRRRTPPRPGPPRRVPE